MHIDRLLHAHIYGSVDLWEMCQHFISRPHFSIGKIYSQMNAIRTVNGLGKCGLVGVSSHKVKGSGFDSWAGHIPRL